MIGAAVLGGLPPAEDRSVVRGDDTVRIARLAPAVAAVGTRDGAIRPYRRMPPHWIDARRLDGSSGGAATGPGAIRPRHYRY